MKKCPYCAEEIQDEAIVCKHCGRDLAKPAVLPKIDTPQDLTRQSNKKSMGALTKIGLAVLIVFGLIFVGFAITVILISPQIKMPDDLNAQMSKVLDEGATLTAMTKQGVNFQDFSNQLAKTRGAYDLAVSLQLEKFAPDAKTNFDKAFQGWDLTLYLWNAKINKKDNPVEPSFNRYAEFIAYSGDQLVFDVFPSGLGIANYNGKKYLPFDKNIRILLSVASDYFKNGQTLIMQKMK